MSAHTEKPIIWLSFSTPVVSVSNATYSGPSSMYFSSSRSCSRVFTTINCSTYILLCPRSALIGHQVCLSVLLPSIQSIICPKLKLLLVHLRKLSQRLCRRVKEQTITYILLNFILVLVLMSDFTELICCYCRAVRICVAPL